MDFSNTKISFSRPLSSYSKVRGIYSRMRRARRSQFDNPKLKDKSILDIGCGPKINEDVVSLDYVWRPGVDVVCDVTRGIPFPSQSFEGIFSEHCLEHIPFISTDKVLAECYRLLKPGGNVRIVVPDGELYLRGYIKSLEADSAKTLPYADGDGFEGLYSPILSVNRIFRESGHLFIYDYEMFRMLLERNGFKDVKKEGLMSGRMESLLRDSPEREVESLYVEATKPAED